YCSFFFSSRRRHTRFSRDWSSDVCSSDLEFVVDMRSPGITVKPIVDMTGGRHFCEVHFDDVRVPAENLVGQENGSFRQIMRQMEHERGGIDRLVSNRRPYEDVRPLADRSH